MGTLLLEIENGRFFPIYDIHLKKNRKSKPCERKCKICKSNLVEDEIHFVCVCPLYQDLRTQLYDVIKTSNDDFIHLTITDKFIYILTNHQLDVSSYIVKAWKLRQQHV